MSVITNIQCSNLFIDFAKNKMYFTNLLQCLNFILQRAVFYYDLPKHKNYNTYTHNRHLNPIEKLRYYISTIWNEIELLCKNKW